MHAWSTSMLLLLHSAFMLSVVKLLLKGEAGVCALNSHGNYIVDHEKSWKNHGIAFLNFCGNPGIIPKMTSAGSDEHAQLIIKCNLIINFSTRDTFCKQFGPRSGPAKCQAWSGFGCYFQQYTCTSPNEHNVRPDQDPNCFKLWWYSWKNFLKKLILKKNQQTANIHAKLPSRQIVKIQYSMAITEYIAWQKHCCSLQITQYFCSQQ